MEQLFKSMELFPIKPNMQELDCDFLCFSGHKICGQQAGIFMGKNLG
jgi:selenocysteine lyase/cysteine desulfurase